MRDFSVNGLLDQEITFNSWKQSNSYASVNEVFTGWDNSVIGAKPLSEPMLPHCEMDHKEQT